MEKFILNLVSCSLLMTLVSFFLMLLFRPLKSIQSAKGRYYSWILVFIGYLIVFKPSFGEGVVRIDTDGLLNNASAETGTEALCLNITTIYFTVFLIWICGVVASLSKVYFQQLFFMRSITRTAVPAAAKIINILDEVTDELMIWEDIRAISSEAVATPMIVGFFKPVIILPVRDMTNNELRLILKHELIHFKHRDLYFKAFMIFVKSVHWFNPFIGFFMRRAEQECEIYCDEDVMRGEGTASRKLYCQSILNALKTGEDKAIIYSSGNPAVSSNFFNGKSGLKLRMKMILSNGKKHKLVFLCVITAAVLVIFSGTVLAFSVGDDKHEDALAVQTSVYNFFEGSSVVLYEASVTTSLGSLF